MSRAFVICAVMSTMSVSLALRTSAFYFKSMGFVAHPFHLHAMWIGCKRNAGLPENLDRLARFSQPKHDAEQQRLGFRQCLRVKPVQMGEPLLQARREPGKIGRASCRERVCTAV